MNRLPAPRCPVAGEHVVAITVLQTEAGTNRGFDHRAAVAHQYDDGRIAETAAVPGPDCSGDGVLLRISGRSLRARRKSSRPSPSDCQQAAIRRRSGISPLHDRLEGAPAARRRRRDVGVEQVRVRGHEIFPVRRADADPRGAGARGHRDSSCRCAALCRNSRIASGDGPAACVDCRAHAGKMPLTTRFA